MLISMRMMRSTPLLGLALVFLLSLLSSQPVRGTEQFLCDDVTEIRLVECQALVALYNSTNGAGWIDNTNWLVTTTPSNWYGVTVASGAVTQLLLQENGLSGVIPTELGSLSSLAYLYLNDNQLNGYIPSALGNLPSLAHLDLGGNQLIGIIPPELGSLSSLEHLYLNSNQLTGGIPPQLGSLTHLSRLYLYDNLLSGPIPSELGDLTNLWSLWLSGNELTGPIPPEFGHLTALAYLRLADNQLSGEIPAEMAMMTSLDQLSLGRNQLSGEIPSELSSLSNLRILSLAGNQLSGPIPLELGALTGLYELDLSSNQLSGSIPSLLGDLPFLYLLRLEQNQFMGDIPDSFSNLIYLLLPGEVDGGDGLDLDYNALNVPENYPDPSSTLQLFLNQYDPDWHTRQAFEQVIGTTGGVLTALDSRASFVIPVGALNGDTTFTFTPLPAPAYDPGELVDAHHSFQLTAENAYGVPVITFNLPLSVTLTYTDTDVLDLSEASLALYYWNSGTSTWLDAGTTCAAGAYTRDLLANSFTLPLCHLSDFSVFGQPVRQTFLPLIVRRAGGLIIP
jgi:Leucine-rich repeat (LRR) protein